MQTAVPAVFYFHFIREEVSDVAREDLAQKALEEHGSRY
jgi:hypothetical protein